MSARKILNKEQKQIIKNNIKELNSLIDGLSETLNNALNNDNLLLAGSIDRISSCVERIICEYEDLIHRGNDYDL